MSGAASTQLYAALLLGGVFGISLALALGRYLRRRRARARFARAARKEAEAARLLQRRGYEVLAAQVEGRCLLLQDGEPLEAPLRADYLVSRGLKRYIAEVKSGARAPDVLDRHTRRQLLEYSAAYEVDGVLLVDAESGAVSEIAFPALRRRRGGGFALGALLGAAGAALLFLLGR
jgi:hypothetical protein